MAAISMGRAGMPAPGALRGSSLSAGSAILGLVAQWLGSGLGTFAEHAYRRVRDHSRLSRDARRLAQLDDRMLRDIGLSRAEIVSAVYGKGSGERRCDDQH